MPRSTTLTAAALTALAACAFAAPAASQVTTAGGEVVSTAQKHLVGNLITLDSIQAATAKLAATKTQNAEVREFASTLAADHGGHAIALQRISDKKDVGREAEAGNTTATEFATRYTSLESMPAGPEFDRAFLQAIVANHQAEIAVITSGKSAAKDDDLKKDLDECASTLRSHLSKAHDLSSKLDKDAMAPAKPPL
jgi:putative membrane protein